MKANCTYAEMAKKFTYCPLTGVLRVQENTTRKKRGDIATSVRRNGYLIVTVKGRHYQAARVCWLLHYGAWPEGFIDHTNLNPADNRICNLRTSTPSQNNANRARYRTKYDLPKGVMPGRGSTFKAQISINGRCRFLGTFPTVDAAHAAYVEAAKKYHGQFARVA